MSQITSEGFTRTRLDERLAQLQEAVRAIFGQDIDLSPDSIDGQTLGIYAESISDLDQLGEDVWQGFSPQYASGLALSRLVKLNGIRRQAGTYSTVTVTCTGNPGTTIPAGSLVTSTTLQVSFETVFDAVVGGGGTVSVEARATTVGAIVAPSGTLNKIGTPTFGWQSVTNALDATVGRDEETDAQLRVRRARSTATPAQAVLDSIYGALANVQGVTQVRVWENDTDAVDVRGLPAHSIYCVVEGGDDKDIAAAIWLRKSAGVTMVGAVSKSITDTQGNPHTIKFSRPTEVNIYVIVNVETRTGWPDNGGDLIEAALVEWATAEQEIGEELIYSRLFTPVNTIPGFSVTSLFVGTSAAPTGTSNISIAFDRLAKFDTSRITVNVSTPP